MTKFKLLLILFLCSLTVFGQDSTDLGNQNPLVVIHKLHFNEKILKILDSKKIDSVKVLKDKNAENKYGKIGQNGVIEIYSNSYTKKELRKLNRNYKFIIDTLAKKNFIIKGNILDCEGSLPGGFITNLNTKKSTNTDFDGNFSIEVSLNDVLKIEHISYKNQTIIIKSNSDLKIQLVASQQILLEKPVIYLYPTEKTEITLSLDFKGKLLTTFPKYDKNWNVIAEPNGQLFDTKTKRTYSSLFWDGAISFEPEHYQYENGFVVEKEKLTDFLIEKLEQIGLNTTETNEFVQFWLPILERNKYTFVHFLVNDECNEVSINNVTPKPETSIRVYMEFYGLNNFTIIKEQVLIKTKRKGFTLVEWGGSDVSKMKNNNL